MKQVVSSDVDDSYSLMTLALSFNLNMSPKIETPFNSDFSNLCEWFVDNKLSIHLKGTKLNRFCVGRNAS